MIRRSLFSIERSAKNPEPRHVLAVTLLTAALALTGAALLSSWDIAGLPLLIAAVMFSSWYGELQHGLMTAVVVLGVAEAAQIAPFESAGLDARTAEEAVVFLLVALFVSTLNASRKRVIRELDAMRTDLEARVQARTAELSRAVQQLEERVKELTLLHSAASALREHQRDPHSMLQHIASLLPFAYQYPSVTQARIVTDLGTYATPGFVETPWMQRTTFTTPLGGTGSIEVVYLDERPRADEGPFLREERQVLESMSSMLRAYFEQLEAVDQRVELARVDAARREAEQASQTKDQFLATVSHELRTPLAVIRGWVQILRRRGDDPVLRTRALDLIDTSTDMQTRLVSDLLDVSRILAGKLAIMQAPVDLEPLVTDTVDAIRPAAEAKHLDLVLACAGTAAGIVSADKGRLQQVLTNLLSNAMKFTPEGGRIEVTVDASRDQVSIRIADSGVGIDAAFLPSVFERFSQETGSVARGGLGLGLSIVRHLVERHGGRVEITSDGRNLGTQVLVVLPVLMQGEPDRTTSNGLPLVSG